MPEILTLDQASFAALTQVGGKAFNLGRLLSAGFDVPSGFVVTPQADPDAILAYINGGLWAVRSSAAEEDSGNRSFAGQHESFLHVPASEVPARIRACRQSLQSQAAHAYRNGHQASEMAVIVQQMLTPQASGVAFTLDPTRGDRDHLWVEMAIGTGDELVGGTIAPQSLRIPREPSEVQEISIPSGLPIPADRVPLLAELLLRVESFFNSPQDIEWAYENGKFWLLQSRPITTASIGWTRANIGEVMPGVVTPLTWSVFRRHVTGQADGNEQALRLLDGKAHLNKTLLIRSFEWLVWADAGTVGKALGLEASGQAHRHNLMEWGASVLFLMEVLGLTKRLQNRVRRFQKMERPQKSSGNPGKSELLNRIAAWDEWTAQAFQLHLYTTTYAVGAYGLLASQLQRYHPQEADTIETAILLQLANSQSGEIGRRLQNLAARALNAGLKADGNLLEDADFASGLEAFLLEFGDRAVEEFELHTPRWREDPAPVLALIRRYMQQPTVSTGTTPMQTVPTNRFLQQIQAGYMGFVALREAMKHEVIRGYGSLRQLYLALGEQFMAQGLLTKGDDIFFLDKNEIENLPHPEDIRTSVRLRRAQWQRQQHLASVGSASSLSTGTAVLKGIGCSRGVIEGKARVVHSFDAGLIVQPDEILVVPQADPAWTPLFLCAAGVVSEIGGFLSHSATVAREFGIPAVFNVSDATDFIQTGQNLQVDGTYGIVKVLV